MSIRWEIEELACRACGKSEEEAEEIINNGTIDELLLEKYEIDFEQYCQIVEDLIPFTPISETAIKNTLVHGFVDGNTFIVKKELAAKSS